MRKKIKKIFLGFERERGRDRGCEDAINNMRVSISSREQDGSQKMIPTIVCLAVILLCSWTESRSASVEVIWADGECNHATYKGSFHLEYTVFDEDTGRITTTKAITTEQDFPAFMIGYVSGRRKDSGYDLVFASQNQERSVVDMDVRLFNVSFDFSSNVSSSTPTNLIRDVSKLLEPCSNISSQGFPPCEDVDLFFPRWTENGDVVFGYRTWTTQGFPRGNQALALLRTSDGSIETLTFNDTDIHTADTCPMQLFNGDHIFIREFEEGYSRSVALVRSLTKEVVVLEYLPPPADWSGCLVFAQKDRFLYIGDETPASEFGKKAMYAVNMSSIDKDGRYEFRKLFSVPLVDTRSVEDALSIQYCVSINAELIACNNIDKKVSIIEIETGAIRRNFTMPEHRSAWDMTSYSYFAFLNE